jgi:hypothetical protein
LLIPGEAGAARRGARAIVSTYPLQPGSRVLWTQNV